MKILAGFSMAVLVLAACGKTTSQDQTETVQAGEKITFNDEIKAALTSESSALPMAMIVKVDLDAAGNEDLSKAELRTANVVSSDAQATWNSGSLHPSPADQDRLVIVNPPEAAASPMSSGVSDHSYYPGNTPNSYSETGDANVVGSNGIVVTGNNNYAYYNAVTNNTHSYDASAYSYTVRPTPDHRQRPECDGWNDSGYEPNQPHCQKDNRPSAGGWGDGSYNDENNNNWNFSGQSYYTYGYRPVFRSRNFNYGGIFGYWGFYVVPVRFVQGNSCYYVYQRPYHRRPY